MKVTEVTHARPQTTFNSECKSSHTATANHRVLKLHSRLFCFVSGHNFQSCRQIVIVDKGFSRCAVFRLRHFYPCSMVKRSERNRESLSRSPDGVGCLRRILERLYTPRQPPGVHGIWSGSVGVGAGHLASYAQARSAPPVITFQVCCFRTLRRARQNELSPR